MMPLSNSSVKSLKGKPVGLMKVDERCFELFDFNGRI